MNEKLSLSKIAIFHRQVLHAIQKNRDKSGCQGY